MEEILNSIKLYYPYKSRNCGYFEVVKIVHAKEKTLLKIRFCKTGTEQFITPNQFKYRFATDPFADIPDIMGVGFSDGHSKEENYEVWKLWLDIILRYLDKNHRAYRYYGAKKTLVNKNWVHYNEFIKYYNYRCYIGRPIINYNDSELYVNKNNPVTMVNII